MKNKILGGIAVLAIAVAAMLNVNMTLQKSNLSGLSLDGIEALAGEQRCLSSPTNTGTCRANFGSEGDSCVTAGFWDSKNCNGVAYIE